MVGWLVFVFNGRIDDICSNRGAGEHVVRVQCREPCNLFLRVYELQLNKIRGHAHKLHGDCFFTDTRWGIHL